MLLNVKINTQAIFKGNDNLPPALHFVIQTAPSTPHRLLVLLDGLLVLSLVEQKVPLFPQVAITGEWRGGLGLLAGRIVLRVLTVPAPE